MIFLSPLALLTSSFSVCLHFHGTIFFQLILHLSGCCLSIFLHPLLKCWVCPGLSLFVLVNSPPQAIRSTPIVLNVIFMCWSCQIILAQIHLLGSRSLYPTVFFSISSLRHFIDNLISNAKSSFYHLLLQIGFLSYSATIVKATMIQQVWDRGLCTILDFLP